LTSYVLDASVAAKWFLRAEEPLAAEALQLFESYRAGETDFLVPDLFFAEFANILWKAQLRGRCDATLADSAIREVIGIGFPAFSAFSLIEAAIQIARAYQRTVYDCIYVALAVETRSEMVTADERLANSLPGLPVVWLGLL
jgi:predicted nucleic acid-binding protein